jgi:hypothetical protein
VHVRGDGRLSATRRRTTRSTVGQWPCSAPSVIGLGDKSVSSSAIRFPSNRRDQGSRPRFSHPPFHLPGRLDC